MSYKLKPNKEPFQIMGGPDEGKKFERGRTYDAMPAGYEDRFDSTDAVAPAAKPFPVSARRKSGADVETPGKESDQ